MADQPAHPARLVFGIRGLVSGTHEVRLYWMQQPGGPILMIVEYPDPTFAGRADRATAEALQGGLLREIYVPAPQPACALPGPQVGIFDQDGRLVMGVKLIRREVVSPHPRPPVPVELERLKWASKRLDGTPGKGRPPGSGEIDSLTAFFDLVAPAIHYFRSLGVTPSRDRVAGFLFEHDADPRKKLQRHWQKAGFRDWKAVLSAVPEDQSRPA